MEYRNDLEAARMRIETLEAKIAERDASLKARDAELAERERALARVAPNAAIAPRQAPWKLALVAALFGFLLLGAIVTVLVLSRGQAGPGPSVVENGPVAEGRTNLPPVAPKPPLSHVEGQAATAEPSPPLPQVEGRVTPPEPNAPPTEVTGSADGAGSDTLADQVEAAKKTTRQSVGACLATERKTRPQASGFVRIVFDVEPTGKVSAVTVKPLFSHQDPWWSKAFEGCVVGVYKGLSFRSFSGTKTAATHTHSLHGDGL